MTVRKFLYILGLAAAITTLAFIGVVNIIDPTQASSLGFILFYLAFFVMLTSWLALVSFICRKIFTRVYLDPSENAQRSLRQSLWWSLIVVVAIYLQTKELLTWLNVALLVLFLAVIEFFILSLRKKQA
ncbi:MAG: hypothetical protein NTV81_00835 [Candidatus Komeilibacteria bacterium]|nr:hypothetical protein [Candidatus Komeilibacteria bacterium]